ncbi:MAG: outer membrane protein transport protein [Phascolarctobacterium sp.]|nr:outer membrane protein transport protein [Phascolarctobacterium sp.]
MKKHLLALSAAAVLLAPQAVGAEGFSINEWSAEGFAMGGARMFAENDAANMAYNPASLTKIKGEVAKISATYISPHGKYKTENAQYGVGATGELETTGHNRVHPAWAPGMYYVKQINDKEWLGFGSYARFGNSCQFEPGSLPGYNNTSSKLNGMSIGVNYAKKLDSKWSASLGAEVNYAWLQIDKTLPYATFLPAGNVQVEGESYALGWNAAVNYEFDDKNEMGIVYRSAVNHSMEANVRDNGYMSFGEINGATDAYGCVTLPESVMIGYNHKFNDKTRVELNGTWTRWSRFDAFNMTYSGANLSYHGQPMPSLTHPDARNWKDGWRYAIGVEHKLSDKYSLLAGVAHDESSIPDYEGTLESMGADFMVPTGTRTTFTIGTQYHDDRQTVAFTIGYMKVGDLSIEGDTAPGNNKFYNSAKMYDSYTKLVSISYQYNF